MGGAVQCLSQVEIIQTSISYLPEGCPNHRTRNKEPLSSIVQQPCCSCIKASPHLFPWTATTVIRLFSTVWQGAQILRFRFTNAISGFPCFPRTQETQSPGSLDISRHLIPCSSWCGCLCSCVSLVYLSAQLTLFWRVRWGLVLNMHQGHMDLSPWQPSQESCGADREAVRLTQPSALHIIICFFQSPAASVTDGVCHWGLDLWPTPLPHLSLPICIYVVSLVKLY